MYCSANVLRAAVRSRHSGGGVLIVALLLTAAATLGFTAWANLIAQRRQNIEETVGGINRRLAVENGRQVAIQLGYNQLLSKNTGAAVNSQITDPNTLQVRGGLTTTARAGYAMASESPGKVNHFSPSGTSFGYGPEFNHTVPFSVMDFYPSMTWRADNSTGLTTAVRSRVPMLSGDILNIYQPTLAVDSPVSNQIISGNLDVIGGRAVILSSAPLANFSALRASAVATPVYIVPATNPVIFRDPETNSYIQPSNFPSTLLTTGPIGSGDNLDLQNRLNVVDSVMNSANSLRNKIINESVYVTVDTTQDRPAAQGITYVASTGVLTFDLSESAFWGVLAENHLTTIVLRGQSANLDAQASVRVCYVEDANISTRSLTKIICEGVMNLRPIVIGIKKLPLASGSKVPGSRVDLDFLNSNMAPEWRMMLVAENTPLGFTASGGPGTLTLKGGIMTDGSIAASSGAGNRVRLIRETDSSHLIQLVPRRAWLETYLDFTNGSL